MSHSNIDRFKNERLDQLLAKYENERTQINPKAKEEQATAQDEKKNTLLVQILDQSARARLNTLMVGKPEKGKMVESMLMQMAQRGQIGGKIGESDLIGLLENVNEQMAASQVNKVKFDRRRAAVDSDSDDDNL